jgi:type II secretory pathway pseudopilin PulG
MKLSSDTRGYKLVELVFTVAIVSVLGLVLYSLLVTDTVLGAKNTAVNTAHQQARTAMLQMMQDLHGAVSLPYLIDASGNPVSGAGPAAGIAFQQWGRDSNGKEVGPYQLKKDANTGDNFVKVIIPATDLQPTVGQRLIIPMFQIEGDITAVSGPNGDTKLTLANIYGPQLTAEEASAANLTFPVVYPITTIPIDIDGTATYHINCFLTDRCAYKVVNNSLQWQGPTTKKAFSSLGGDITNPVPFSIPITAAGALYYRFVAAINLSTSDLSYSNRNFKSANILLNGQVPMRARLTTYNGQ